MMAVAHVAGRSPLPRPIGELVTPHREHPQSTGVEGIGRLGLNCGVTLGVTWGVVLGDTIGVTLTVALEDMARKLSVSP